MKTSALHELYLEQLRALFDAENLLLKELPLAAKAATRQELRDALDEHCDQCEEHVRRLKKIFEREGANPKGRKCTGMDGLIAEMHEWIDAAVEPELLDAALIGCVQRIEHYEIAAYGCACAYARLMSREDAAQWLEETLDEEKEADEILTDVADNTVNRRAHQGEGAEEEEEEEADEKEEKESPRNADDD